MVDMDQLIEMKWERSNRKYYSEKGYQFTKYKDLFYVKAKDISKGSHKKVIATCDFCGECYEISFQHAVKTNAMNQKHSCYKCRHKKIRENDLAKRQNNLYNRAKDACDKKGYVLNSDKEDIVNNTAYVKYICPKHGIHEMRINNLISGKGCPDCVSENYRSLYQLSYDEVEERIRIFGGVLLNKEDYKNQTTKNLKILCPECGEPFVTSLRNFTQHGGQVCNNCHSTETLGERLIRHYLEQHKINFVQEKWFDSCRDVNPLPFDFYLPNHNTIIEFDGRQHFGDTNYFSYSFEQTKKHDEIKNKYCKNNGIKIIRIPFWNIDKINKILDKELISHEDIV